MTDRSFRDHLIEEAEQYQKNGEPLPLDLYSDLMQEGVDASLYNNVPVDQQEGKTYEN